MDRVQSNTENSGKKCWRTCVASSLKTKQYLFFTFLHSLKSMFSRKKCTHYGQCGFAYWLLFEWQGPLQTGIIWHRPGDMVDDRSKVGRAPEFHSSDSLLIGLHHSTNPSTERVCRISILQFVKWELGIEALCHQQLITGISTIYLLSNVFGVMHSSTLAQTSPLSVLELCKKRQDLCSISAPST